MNHGSCSTSPSGPEACITLPALSPELYPPQPALLMSDFRTVGDAHPEPSTMGSSGKGTLNKISLRVPSTGYYKGSFKGSGTLHGTRIKGAPVFGDPHEAMVAGICCCRRCPGDAHRLPCQASRHAKGLRPALLLGVVVGTVTLQGVINKVLCKDYDEV